MTEHQLMKFVSITSVVYTGRCTCNGCSKQAEQEIALSVPGYRRMSGSYCGTCGEAYIGAVKHLVYILAMQPVASAQEAIATM